MTAVREVETPTPPAIESPSPRARIELRNASRWYGNVGKPAAGRPDVYRTLALVPEREAVHAFLTGYEFVRMSARLQQLDDVEGATARAIALVDLQPAQHRRIGTYSKGMRQRIKIAGALVHDPQILLLDEPFNGMDPRQRLQMMEVMRGLAAEGRVVVISSHILEELNDLATNQAVDDRPAAHVHDTLIERPCARVGDSHRHVGVWRGADRRRHRGAHG